VELAQASVFGTFDAEQIERLLAAIDTPGDLRRLRAALATDWLGLDATALWNMEHSETIENSADAMSWVERFSRYRMLWHERGFAVMWRTLARELLIAQRLVVGLDGERRLTNVNHLAELIQARGAVQPGIAPMLRWLAAQRAEQGGGEDAQLRLESDRNLVQIVTVHKSKGLEYAVVFCPFLNDGALRDPPSTGLPDAREYHDDGAAVLHYGYTDEEGERASGLASREQAAERARLVYVALTRAVYRCYVVGGVYLIGKSAKESRRSVLNWLVAGAGHTFGDWLAEPPEEDDVIGSWQTLASGSISVEPLPVIDVRDPLVVRRDAAFAPEPRTSRRVLRDSWRTASFSSMIAAGAREESNQAQPTDERPDHDGRIDAIASIEAPSPVAPVQLDPDDILAFPRGPSAGECLHRMYELADFTNPRTWPKAIESALHEHPIPVSASEALATNLPAMMTRLLADTVTTELVPGMRLDAIATKRRMNELEFLYPAAALDFPALRRVLITHGFPDVALEAGTLRGFVKGFIDMIVEHEGRFWIVDWKSNHLGLTPADYDERALDAAMASHAYHLQALFYVVALHRYLRVRLRDYSFERHIGGYLYLFVRGVRPDWRDGERPAGVHVGKPSLELIDALDRLMQGVAA
jgi:exodeoxyribonuclease V beta subunit